MSNFFPAKEQFIDAKSIPKFQFQLIDEELISCIKQLYVQSKIQEKSMIQYKKDIMQKLTTDTYAESLQQLQKAIVVPPGLQNIVSSSGKKKDYNDPSNPILTRTVQLSNKFTTITELISALNSRILNMQKRIVQSQDKTNLLVKEKITSVQEQLVSFVKDYRINFKDISSKFEDSKTKYENKAKQIQTNTLWKINQCSKRLEDRPNIEMVKSAIAELQMKITRSIQSGSHLSAINVSSLGQSTKLQQQMLKLQKAVNFNTIEMESKIKMFIQKVESNFLNLKAYADEKIDITKKLQNLNVLSSDLSRKVRGLETNVSQLEKEQKQLSLNAERQNQELLEINQKIKKFTKSDQFAKLMQKIDPHQICRLGGAVKTLQDKAQMSDQRLKSLNSYVEALKSKVEFWNVANSQNPQKNSGQQINVQLMAKIIKEEINNSDFKLKLLRFQQQLVDLSSVKEGLNDMMKRIAKVNKQSDLSSLKYEILGVQQYIKRQILIVSNKVTTLQSHLSGLGDLKKRSMSAQSKINESKLFSSVSTKKLLPVSCISCHQSNTVLTERRTVFKSKLADK